ncbi:MAG TPA: hypothetical protein O0X94_05275 [Methanocorpusculum sp.]|nr:hypothetical protein [Methanocorpusculum sp.]
MKKFIIVVGLLLVAAVFMSGCVTETEDPIVGVWNNYASETVMVGVGVASTSMVFNADGTGFSLTDFTGELAYAELDFTWKKEGDGKYIIERPDYWYDVGIMPQYDEKLTLDGDKLSVIAGEYVTEFRRQPVAEYVLGLWASDVGDYAGYEDIRNLLYFSEDGTGNSIVFSSEVMGIDDVYTSVFSWEEKDGVITLSGDKGNTVELTFENGLLYMDGANQLHKYTVEDHLLGLWMSDEPSKEAEGTFDIVILLRPDGTGVEIWTLPGSHVASAKYYCDWEMTSSTTYQAVYDDGEVWDFAADGLGLTDGGVTYSKVGYDVLAEYAKKVTA